MSPLPPSLSAHLAGIPVGDTLPVRLMAVLNVSPESFYPDSVHTNREQIAETAHALAGEGADIIDIGAMSTAPYLKTDISEAEETERLAAAVEATATAVSVPISADTKRSQPAQAALRAGARIINDVSGLKNDPAMAALIARSGAGAILMASEQRPQSGPPLERIRNALRDSLTRAEQAGIPEQRIVLDPGIGFFREPGIAWDEWDCLVLRELAELRSFGFPLLVGASRKAFIGKILGQPTVRERLIGSLTCAAVAVVNGAHIIRVHDVKATTQAVRMAERLRRPLGG